jgi:hypothetical protein
MAPSNKSSPGRNNPSSKVNASDDGNLPKRVPASPKKKIIGLARKSEDRRTKPVVAVKRPKLIFGQRYTAGVAGVFVCEAHEFGKQAYIHPIVQTINADDELAESLFVHGIYNRRHPTIEDNEMMGPDATRPGTPGFFKTFVRIFTDEEELDHAKLMEWMGSLKNKFNEIAQEMYTYPTEFEVAEDLTNDSMLEPPSHLLVNEDVIKVMDMSYPREVLSRPRKAALLSRKYFGAWTGARQFIESCPE